MTISAPAGAAVEVRVVDASGVEETVLWIPRFEPRAAETYVLAEPTATVSGRRWLLFGPRGSLARLTVARGSARPPPSPRP